MVLESEPKKYLKRPWVFPGSLCFTVIIQEAVKLFEERHLLAVHQLPFGNCQTISSPIFRSFSSIKWGRALRESSISLRASSPWLLL